MSINLKKYTAEEGQNFSNEVGFGQVGSAFLADVSAYAPPSGYVVIGIQVLEDAVFGSGLTAESTAYTAQSVAAESTNADSFGTSTISQGSTLYGRWTGVQLASGKVMIYVGL